MFVKFVYFIIILSRSQQFPTSSSQNQVRVGDWPFHAQCILVLPVILYPALLQLLEYIQPVICYYLYLLWFYWQKNKYPHQTHVRNTVFWSTCVWILYSSPTHTWKWKWDRDHYMNAPSHWETMLHYPIFFNGFSLDVHLGIHIAPQKSGAKTLLNRHQTILHTFSQLFLNLTLSGVPHLYRQLANGQYLSDLCKMCNLEANLWKMGTGDHRILTYIFKWERLNTAGHSHTVSIGHWVAPLYND